MKEKIVILSTKKVAEIGEEFMEGVSDSLQTVESEELDKGMSFGIKLLIIVFIIMLLIYAYIKFVKQGVPLWNI